MASFFPDTVNYIWDMLQERLVGRRWAVRTHCVRMCSAGSVHFELVCLQQEDSLNIRCEHWMASIMSITTWCEICVRLAFSRCWIRAQQVIRCLCRSEKPPRCFHTKRRVWQICTMTKNITKAPHYPQNVFHWHLNCFRDVSGSRTSP